jgi:hypothetical protein
VGGTALTRMLPLVATSSTGTGVTPAAGLLKLTFHSGWPPVPTLSSASNAYTLLFIVATYTTLRVPLLGTATLRSTSSCA